MKNGSATILVVDDDTDFRELLVEHLVATGHHVRAASDGAEALRTLSSDRGIGLVLLDLRMPVMDGFELLRRASVTTALAAIPVVVITAEHETRDVASAPNVVAVLHKPLDTTRLDALAATHVRR